MKIAAQLHKLVFHGPYSFLDFHRKPSFRGQIAPFLSFGIAHFPVNCKVFFKKKKKAPQKKPPQTLLANVILRIDLTDHDIEDIRIGPLHANFADVSNVANGILDVLFNNAFPTFKELIQIFVLRQIYLLK